MIIIGDFLKDLDDEHVLVAASKLHRDRMINLCCVIGNLKPAEIRARGAKGTLKQLGLPEIPVGVGSVVFDGKPYGYETQVPYLADSSEVEQNGEDLLVRSLESCDDTSVILILNSGFTDAANLLRYHAPLFYRKVKGVSLMGGVESVGREIKLVGGYMIPNNADNNTFDMPSAQFLYRRLQEVGVPMVVVMRDLAYTAQVPLSMYDEMCATGNPIGHCLKNRQMPALQHLWEAACSPPNSELRGTLPNDRDRRWFINVFCRGRDSGIADGAEIWPYVGDFNLYDPSNLYAAIPEIRDRFLDPIQVVVNKTVHLVVGLSCECHGMKDIHGFRQFMIDTEIEALKLAA